MLRQAIQIEAPRVWIHIDDVRTVTALLHCNCCGDKGEGGDTREGAIGSARPALARMAPTSAAVPEAAETTPKSGSTNSAARRNSNSVASGPQFVYTRAESMRRRYGSKRSASGNRGRNTGSRVVIPRDQITRAAARRAVDILFDLASGTTNSVRVAESVR